jgi:CRP/FNR family cyclic AMP-dependent transcriptional regulator
MHGDIFEKISFFQDLEPEQLALLRPIFIPCHFPADTTIFKQGELAGNMFIVVAGEVIVAFKPDDGPLITVARLKPGSIVGWSAALGRQFYTSGASASVDTQLLRVRGTDLRQLIEQNSDIGEIILDRLAALIAERLSITHPQVLALLNLGLRSSESEEMDDFRNG